METLLRAWRNWRAARREYAIERALYKAGGGRDARHGGATGGTAGLTKGGEESQIADAASRGGQSP
jgi:hypothetical protein